MSNARGGRLYLKVDGALQEAKGDFTYGIGTDKRESIIGSSSVHGYKRTVQAPFIEGAITDSATLSLSALTSIDGATITLELQNGKTIVLRDAWYVGEGSVSTGEGEIAVRFEAKQGEEIR